MCILYIRKRWEIVEMMNMVYRVYIIKRVYMVKRLYRVEREYMVKRVNRVKMECLSTLSREGRAWSGLGAALGSLSQLSTLTKNIGVYYRGNILHPVTALHLNNKYWSLL